MKMINEAALDEQFNQQMDKIQQAVQKLEKIALGFGDGGVTPVRSQRAALEAAIRDLTKVKAMMFNE